MHLSSAEPIFENRYDAGRQLAEKLVEYYGKPVIVLGIPNGGVAVALSIALALDVTLTWSYRARYPFPSAPKAVLVPLPMTARLSLMRTR